MAREGDFVLQKVFEEHQRSVERRFEDLTKRAEGLHAGIHELRNKITALPMIVQRIEEIVGDLKSVPSRAEIQKDLDHQTVVLSTQIVSAEKARVEREAQKWRTIQLMFWTLGGIATVGTIISLIVTLSQKPGKG